MAAILSFILAAGLCGNLLSLLITQGKGTLTVSAGASGAIFGVFGALLWVIIANRGRVEELNIRGIVIMIALSLYYGIYQYRSGQLVSGRRTD